MARATELVSFDYAIKYLLKNKGDHEIVEGFISALLASEGYPPVKIKALLESESNREEPDMKRSIADLIVEDAGGHKYVIEIDRAWSKMFLHKACFNTSRLIVDSLTAGHEFLNIEKIFHINLLYFPMEGMKSPVYDGQVVFHEVRQESVGLHLIDKAGHALFDAEKIFPDYFVISIPLFDDVIRQELDEWLYVMKHSETRDNFKSPYMAKVAERLNVLKMSPTEQMAYNEYLNKSLKERDYLISAEQKGIEKGIAQGIAEGRAEGMAEGVRQNQLEIARLMLKKGLPNELIAECTGLTLGEIQQISLQNQ